jgi:hypothetical protein
MLALILLLAIYMIPGIIALCRSHRQAVPILVLDLLLGWTLIGWVVALVWSLTTPAAPVVIIKDAGQ